ncbi:MAG: hypothetical protein ONB17_03220 [candidate division KSB1 bacterium]|nr:hypothetical protein [candidate division KSB1 bacterium]
MPTTLPLRIPLGQKALIAITTIWTWMAGLAFCHADQPADLPDLDVTFISRTPRYPRLVVSYHRRADGLVGDVHPYLTPEEEAKKRWPAPGDTVTFTAHVKNHGNAPVAGYACLWAIDGQVVAAPQGGALVPEQEATFKLTWRWQDGPHTVSFQVDPQDVIPELSQRNNQLTDRTDALSFHFHVEQSLYDYFGTIKNSWGTYSWEDWAQSQVALMNDLFRAAIYPTSPHGVTERVRLDMITIHPDGELDPEGTHAPEDIEWDGRWGFKATYLTDKFYEKNPWAIAHEWSLIHELGHQIGRIDLYCLDVTAQQNLVNHEAYRSKYRHCLMHSGIYLPQDEVHFFCEHTAASLNRDKGVRRGHFGEYLLDLPADNQLLVLSADHRPLRNVAVSIYRAEPLGYTEKRIAPPPAFSGKTDDDGLFPLGANPFGEINNWGTNGVLLVKVEKAGRACFRWLEICDFNLEFWRGNRDRAVYQILSDLR